MNTASLKLKLIKQIIDSSDKNIINHIKAVLESNSDSFNTEYLNKIKKLKK